MKLFHKGCILRAISFIREEAERFEFTIRPEHVAEIVLALEHGYAILWNPKFYVRPFIPNDGDSNLIVVRTGNPKPNPGPFRIMCHDIESTHNALTKNLNETLRTIFAAHA